MERRGFFLKAAAGMGTLLTAARMSRSQSWKVDPRATYTKIEDGHEGPWPHWPYEEIRIPYRERAKKVRWPNNAPLCVYTYVTTEWGGHAKVANPAAKFTRDIRSESENGQYEMNVGIWRAIRLLDKFGLKVSIFAHAGMVELFPDLYRENSIQFLYGS